MAITKVISENEEYLRSAINDGISHQAITSTINSVLNKSDEYGTTPRQLTALLSSIAYMKNSVENHFDNNYHSKFVKANNMKLSSAITDGISPFEVAKAFDGAIEIFDMRSISFLIKLVSNMKQVELNLVKQNANTYQKVYNNAKN